MFEVLKENESIDEFIIRLNKEFNTNVLLEIKAFHIGIYPPTGGMWCTEFNIIIKGNKIGVGSNYASSMDEIKQFIYKKVIEYQKKGLLWEKKIVIMKIIFMM